MCSVHKSEIYGKFIVSTLFFVSLCALCHAFPISKSFNALAQFISRRCSIGMDSTRNIDNILFFRFCCVYACHNNKLYWELLSTSLYWLSVYRIRFIGFLISLLIESSSSCSPSTGKHSDRQISHMFTVAVATVGEVGTSEAKASCNIIKSWEKKKKQKIFIRTGKSVQCQRASNICWRD